MREIERINPDPKLVWLIDYAITEISGRVHDKDRYAEWFEWASRWKSGEHRPGGCVAAAHGVFADRSDPMAGALGQVAWGAKEACYSAPKSGWLALRYVADAMIAFGIAFPRDALIDATLDAGRIESAGLLAG